MKIGILTLPLISNYGGILQCFALAKVLSMQKHQVVVLDRRADALPIWKRLAISILRICHIKPYYNKSNKINNNIPHFINNYIPKTEQIKSQKSLKKKCEDLQLDYLVVGSDQIWRADFERPRHYEHFLGFTNSNTKKIAYAASFGQSEWKYNENETQTILDLTSKFKAISVREFDAIKLCENNLSLSPQLVLDPTLLLDEKHYIIFTKPIIKEKYIFVYWLGDKKDAKEIINKYNIDKRVVFISLKDIDILPSVEDWLSYIKYADEIITDSYHGCIFSIIFQKQFDIYLNQSGGVNRIQSLFRILNISKKLNTHDSYLDYKEIIENLDFWKKQSLHFLINNLK